MKSNYFSIALALLIGLLPSIAGAALDALSSVDQCRALAHAVLLRVAAGDDRGAIELLRPHFRVEEKQFSESRDRTLAERRGLTTRFGPVLSTPLVREERVSDFLYRLTYVEKREFHLVRWQFTFYRATNNWQLNSYTWDDNVSALFDRPPTSQGAVGSRQ